jgi:hypothetical protein
MSEPLLKISNHHSPSCGDPPIVSDDTYVGYFEGTCGDQWIFTFDRKTKTAELRGGDVGWNRAYVVRGGRVPELVLSSEEAAWLTACWAAACPPGMSSGRD